MPTRTLEMNLNTRNMPIEQEVLDHFLKGHKYLTRNFCFEFIYVVCLRHKT